MFRELSSEVDFEDVGKGRKGNHLVKIEDEDIPLVRTTSKFEKPAHGFSGTHDFIVSRILDFAKNNEDLRNTPISFNHALIEIYDKYYFKMKYHSDQALDLENNSCIALFSCYERPEGIAEPLVRKLKIRNKVTNEEHEYSLENNSVVLFSLPTNSKYQHKIVLDASSNKKDLLEDNRWLGVTFRKSKTFVRFKGNQPWFKNGEALKLADEDQQREFYRLRGQENKSLDFTYPWIGYTLSKSDTMIPK
ncbi:MAG: alpha-ketoglutarate-dependent dioxygenase AlkB [Bacteroidota bacterium]